MVGYYDKPKKKRKEKTHRDSTLCKQTSLWNRQTNYPREADRPTLGIKSSLHLKRGKKKEEEEREKFVSYQVKFQGNFDE